MYTTQWRDQQDGPRCLNMADFVYLAYNVKNGFYRRLFVQIIVKWIYTVSALVGIQVLLRGVVRTNFKVAGSILDAQIKQLKE